MGGGDLDALDEVPQACFVMDPRRGRNIWANQAGLLVLDRTLEEHQDSRPLDGLEGEQLTRATGVLEELALAVQDGGEARDLHGPLIEGDRLAGLGRKFVTTFSRIRVKNFPPSLMAHFEEPTLEGCPSQPGPKSPSSGVWLCLGQCQAITKHLDLTRMPSSPDLANLPKGSFNEGVSLALSQLTGPDSVDQESVGLTIATERLRALEMLRQSPIFSSLFERDGGELVMATPRASAFYEEKLGNVRAPGRTCITLEQVFGVGFFGVKNPSEPAFDGPKEALEAMDRTLYMDKLPNFKFQQQQLTSKHKKRWVEFECWPAKDPVTGRESVLVSQTNITQLKGLEVSLKAAQKELTLQNTQLKEELDLQREKQDGAGLNLMGPLDETLAMLARVAGSQEQPSRREIEQLMKTLASARDVRAPTNLKASLMDNSRFSRDVGMSLMTMLDLGKGGGGERRKGSSGLSTLNSSQSSKPDSSPRSSPPQVSNSKRRRSLNQIRTSLPATVSELPGSPRSSKRGTGRSWDSLSSSPPIVHSNVFKKIAGNIRKAFLWSKEKGKTQEKGDPNGVIRTPTWAEEKPERRQRRSSSDNISHFISKACRMYHQPSQMPPQLLHDLETSSSWQFDAFSLFESSKGHPLSTLGFYLIKESGLVQRFSVIEKTLMTFLLKVEDGYPENMYHNRTHAADVLQSMYMLMVNALGGFIGDMELLVGIIAAVCHDYKHIGVNNDFLVRSGHDLAVLYNGNSPMENHHASSTLFLLKQREYDFLAEADAVDRRQFNKLFITLILSTDMSSHFNIVGKFSNMFTNEAVIECVQKACSSSSRSYSADLDNESPVTGDHISLALQMSIKMADLGHVLAEPKVHLKWVNSLEEEYFRQGDKEKVVFGPSAASPLMDRASPGITASQCGFFEIVVVPLYESFANVFTGAAPALRQVHINYGMWQAKEKEGQEMEKALKKASKECAALQAGGGTAC